MTDLVWLFAPWIVFLVSGAVDGRNLLLRIVVPFGALVLAFCYIQAQQGSKATKAAKATKATIS